MIRLIIIIVLAVILYCLASALFYLVRENNQQGKKTNQDAFKMARALGWRIGLSMTLFLLLFLFYALGWIVPHGVGQ